MPPPLLDGFGGKAKNYINDIAVLVLERDVKGVKPRAIAKEIQTDSARYVRLVGFGATNSAGTEGYGIKREVDVPMASTACGAQGDQVQYGCNGGIEFVAGKPFLNLDSCNGDSGGPAYIWYESDWLLAGVTSRPTKNSKQACGDGGVYTRVDKFETWFHPQHYNDLI
jgi:secreted trypsin-like serine protease